MDGAHRVSSRAADALTNLEDPATAPLRPNPAPVLMNTRASSCPGGYVRQLIRRCSGRRFDRHEFVGSGVQCQQISSRDNLELERPMPNLLALRRFRAGVTCSAASVCARRSGQPTLRLVDNLEPGAPCRPCADEVSPTKWHVEPRSSRRVESGPSASPRAGDARVPRRLAVSTKQ
jgi:hypothetical protein